MNTKDQLKTIKVSALISYIASIFMFIWNLHSKLKLQLFLIVLVKI